MADTSIFFGTKQITANSATTSIELEDDVYLYKAVVNYNDCPSTAFTFDTSLLDPEKTEQGSDWGWQILLQINLNGGSSTIPTVTFPSGVIWEQGVTPLMNVVNSIYYIRFEFVDGAIYGTYEGIGRVIGG